MRHIEEKQLYEITVFDDGYTNAQPVSRMIVFKNFFRFLKCALFHAVKITDENKETVYEEVRKQFLDTIEKIESNPIKHETEDIDIKNYIG